MNLPRPQPLPPSGEFVSERLRAAGDDFALPPAVGEPALPLRFVWRRRTCEVRTVLRRWKELDPDRTHGSGHLYLRRHWFELRMTDATVWTVYFLRQPGPRRSAKSRWWLYRVEATEGPAGAAATECAPGTAADRP